MPTNINLDILFDAAAKAKTPASRRNRKYAVICMKQQLQSDELPVEQLTNDTVSNYLTWLLHSGKSVNTVELYRKELRTVFVESYPELESEIKEAFARPTARWNERKDGLNIKHIRTLAQTEFGEATTLTIVRDLFLFSFYCGGIDYDTVRNLTTDNIDGKYLNLPSGRHIILNANIEALITLYAEEDEKLLFPPTKKITEERYHSTILSLSRRCLIPALRSRDIAVKSWITVARSLKIDLATIKACAAQPLGALSSYNGEATTDQSQIDRAINRVSINVADDTMHWYAMRFRDLRTTPEQIFTLLQENERFPFLRDLATYYPCHDIVRRIGTKHQLDSRAYINGVLFFRAKTNYLKPLFSLVNDLAWIYRVSTRQGSTYAIIPRKEMENFQRAISRFTPDMEFSIVRNDQLTVGQHVRILTGQFAGTEGTILSHNDAEPTTYREFVVNFTSENALKFTVNVLECDMEIIED